MFDLNKAVKNNPSMLSLANDIFAMYGGANGVNLNSTPFVVYNEYTNTNDFPIVDVGISGMGLPFQKKLSAIALNSLLFDAWAKNYKIPQTVIDEWTRILQAGADTNQKKSFWQKVKEAATNTFDTVSGGVNNVLEDAKDLGNKLGDKLNTFLNNAPQNVLFAPLLPFVPAMRNQLNKRGFSVSGLGIYDISKMFLDNIVKSKSNYQFAHLDPASIATFAASPEGKDMIKQILDFFLTLANKPTLSSNDKEMLKDAEGGLDEILDTKKVDANGFLKYILLALGLFLAYKFIKK